MEEQGLIYEQKFCEPVYFRYKSGWFYLENTYGIKKVYLEIKDGKLVTGKILVTGVKRSLKNKVRLSETKEVDICRNDVLVTYVGKSLTKLLHDSDYTLEGSGYLSPLTGGDNLITFKDFKLLLYYINAKFVGGYWLTLSSDTPFAPLKYPRYQKIRRVLQIIQKKSISIDDFERKLCEGIEGAYLKRSFETKQFYGLA